MYPEAKNPKVGIPKLLKGQKALVTGGSSGIGEGIALALGEAGADVVVNCHSHPETAEEVAKKIREFGVESYVHQGDVSREEDVLGMFEKMKSEFGTIDILINNAGIQKDSPFTEMSLDSWNKVIGLNLTGQFLCSREAAKEFLRRGVKEEISVAAGKIICISSVHEVIPWAGHANYASSKGGIHMMMQSISQELAPYRIRVNSIGPGAIRTPINKQAWETKEAYDELMHLIPYNRIGEPVDIAQAAVWLASDHADYINGTTLFVDGGMCLFPGFRTGG
ncbi:MAG: SDR family oxidoreductase [Candidatus Algichlamydia australiensis]|nr:SDR family oxidoreductase [Chlamydiales bacterium]